MTIVMVLLAVIVGAAATAVVMSVLLHSAVSGSGQSAVAVDPDVAIAAMLQQLRADREGDLARTVETVLALAGEKLGSQLQVGTSSFEARNDMIAQQIGGMKGELQRVTDVVSALHRERAEHHGALLSGLAETARQSSALASTTQQLREVLASGKSRGQWGERMADDVLRLAGFAEGINYRRQTTLASGNVPDFTFMLPQGLLLHMDVKFPMDNYLRFLDDSSGEDRKVATHQFLRDVRSRVKEITGRGYIEEGVTLGYVLLFIPNEAVYSFIHDHDPALGDLALRQRVVLCSPFTLFAMLGVVRQAVDSFSLQRSTDEILTCLGGFSTQWEKFSDSIEQVGRRLESTSRAYDELAGPRRRQLQRMVDRVDDLRQRRLEDPGVGQVEETARQADVTSPLPPAGPSPIAGSPAELRLLSRRLTG